jgi:hypothetical protein
LPGKRPSWCKACSMSHPGAVDVQTKKCEDCGVKRRTYGVPGETSDLGNKPRWCAGCALHHEGAVDIANRNSSRNRARVVSEIELPDLLANLV